MATGDRIDVCDYFAAPANSYWQWQDQGAVVAWSDGTTIAFRRELKLVLERIRTQNLPPIGSIVLLLAACRDNWGEPNSKHALLLGMLRYEGRPDRSELLERVYPKLNKICGLDSKLRNSPQAKAELAAMVFEGDWAPPASQAMERLLEALEHGLSEKHTVPWPKLNAVDWLLRDLAWLDRGLDRVSAEALKLRTQTGLDEEIVPAKIEAPPAGGARRLIAELLDDPELGGLARLAQLLSSAVQLPTRLSQPEELPVGGVSDISNRGSLDRLLLSELAYDSLTMAARLAMNEALYLRRETPPHQPSRRRLVLIDSGLRMWGVPRVYAAAVGLAMAAGETKGLTVEVYRAAGTELAPVDMTTAAGLNEHLAVLDHRAHPGLALAALQSQLETAGELAEAVLVTGEDVVADHTFQRALAESGVAELHVATVRRDGRFQLHLRTLRGRKLLRSATLALDEILKPRPRPALELLKARDEELPAIFSMQPFPLLLSAPVDVERSWYVHQVGAFTYTRDGRLLHWRASGRGGEQFAQQLPPGSLHWASSVAEDGKVLAVIGKMSARGLFAATIDLDNRRCSCVRLQPDMEQPRRVFVHRQAVYAISDSHLNVLSSVTGAVLNRAQLGAFKHERERFFTLRNLRPIKAAWFAVSFDGQRACWAGMPDHPQLLTVFESTRMEGPIGVTANGQFKFFGDPSGLMARIPMQPENLQVDAVSRDGTRLLMSQGMGQQRRSLTIVDVHTLATTTAHDIHAHRSLEHDLFQTARPLVMRHRFNGIGIDASGRLVLVSRHGQMWPIELTLHGSRLSIPSQPQKVTLADWQHFKLLESPQAEPYALSAARFKDGSLAYLDSRGLLHLKSSEKSVPECTIALAERELSGWTSSGLFWGEPYFIGDCEKTPSWEIERQVLRPFVERAQ